ncbi:MAG TPA: cysteine hydrolase family protein [Caulobacteraceae bacterium]|jgi:nicotinamidase-related amidase|nr:cysteine hydrolase family protein [Caulobacteraceae bacterium]
MPAIIVIDLQTAMLDGVHFPPLHDHERLIDNTNRLTAWARTTGAPVAYVRHDGDPGEAIERGATGWPIHPAVAPVEGEPIFEKTVGDAFAETNLAGWLRGRGIDEVILLGAQTDQCVNATCHGALERGFAVTIAADAHSTVDWKGETAAQIIARHNKMFAELGARVETVDKLVG